MKISAKDRELVTWALEHVDSIESHREAGRVLGVAASTVSDWRAAQQANALDQLGSMRSPTRDKLLAKRRVSAEAQSEEASGRLRVEESDGLAELYRRIDEIEASGEPGWVIVLRVDALAAAVRAEAMRRAEAAGEERARAIAAGVEPGGRAPRPTGKQVAPVVLGTARKRRKNQEKASGGS